MKLKKDIKDGDYLHYCAGCNQLHLINTQYKNSRGAQWWFNGNMELPTFTPSINMDWKVCHYIITDGKVQFCSDSTHELSGHTVELPDIPEDLL